MKATACALGAALALVIGAGTVEAQERYPVGLGVGLRNGTTVLALDDIEILSALAPHFYVTLPATERVMVEPAIGVVRLSYDTGEGPFTSEGTATVLRIGMGVFFTSPAGEDGRIYYGPRVFGVRFSSEVTTRDFDGSESTDSESRLDLGLGAAAGGEFFLVDRLSLGGEVGLDWLKEGNEGDDDESEASSLSTTAEVKVRWYIR